VEHLARAAGGTAFSLLLLAASQGESLFLLAASLESLMQLVASNKK